MPYTHAGTMPLSRAHAARLPCTNTLVRGAAVPQGSSRRIFFVSYNCPVLVLVCRADTGTLDAHPVRKGVHLCGSSGARSLQHCQGALQESQYARRVRPFPLCVSLPFPPPFPPTHARTYTAGNCDCSRLCGLRVCFEHNYKIYSHKTHASRIKANMIDIRALSLQL